MKDTEQADKAIDFLRVMQRTEQGDGDGAGTWRRDLTDEEGRVKEAALLVLQHYFDASPERHDAAKPVAIPPMPTPLAIS